MTIQQIAHVRTLLIASIALQGCAAGPDSMIAPVKSPVTKASSAFTSGIIGQAPACDHMKRERLYVAVPSKKGELIAAFDASAVADAKPICRIVGVDQFVGGLMLDASNRLWVSEETAPALALYAHGSDGAVLPLQDISGNATLLLPWDSLPNKGIARDANGNVWVPNAFATGGGYITAYSADSSGNVAPIATIGYGDMGKAAGFYHPFDVKFDSAGNLFVGDDHLVFVFAPPFTDTSKPIATFTVPSGDMTWYLAFDSRGNLFVGGESSVSVFKGGLKSMGVPWYRFTFAAGAYGIALDSKDQLYISRADLRIAVLKKGARTFQPIRYIASSLFKNYPPTSIVVGR